MRKDVGVEIARIIACLQVICVHICLPMLENSHLYWGRAVFSGLCADGVAVFWLISGFFMFRNYDFRKTMVRTLKKIVIPLFIIDLLCFFFGDFVFRSVPLSESFNHGIKDLFLYVLQIVRGYTPEVEFAHLWFMRVYILLMLISPVAYGFIHYLKQDCKRIRIFVAVTAVLMFINDIGANQLFGFSTHTVNAVFPAFIEMIWGWIIYNRVSGKKIRSLGIIKPVVIFFLLNFLRPLIYLFQTRIGFADTKIYYWYSLSGLLCAVCIVVMSLNIGFRIKNSRVIGIFSILGSGTFTVYIFHMMVYYLLLKIGYVTVIEEMFSSNFLRSTLAIMIIALSVFLFIGVFRVLIMLIFKYKKTAI